MKEIVEFAQILTGIAAVVSLVFTAYAYRHETQQEQLKVAQNVSTWYEETKPEGESGVTYKNIVMNNNPFPVYNVIIVWIDNKHNLSLEETLRSKNIYYEILSPGEKEDEFNSPHAMGGEHLVPELFFTDNQSTEWYRDKRGQLKKTAYIERAVKAGIILGHV